MKFHEKSIIIVVIGLNDVKKMNIKNLKLFLLILVPVFLISGCGVKNMFKSRDFKEPSSYEVTRYKSGTVLIRDNSSQSKKTNANDFTTGSPVTNIPFGPKSIRFAPDDNF